MLLIEEIRKKYSKLVPLYITGFVDHIKLELKPYLQPFEKLLAIKELQSLIGDNVPIQEEQGYYLVNANIDAEYLLANLTFWQRLGKKFMIPTLQKTLELTQNGSGKLNKQDDLHNARRLRYGPHDLHEYRGKFFPQLVRSLINISKVGENAVILDPMCGSGTAPCEVLSSGRNAIGADLNPLSILISKVKSSILFEPAEVFKETVLAHMEYFRFGGVNIDLVWSEADLKYLRLWFDPNAIQDFGYVVTALDAIQNDLYKDFYKVCLSNIIRSNSYQKETDLRVRKEIKPYTKGQVIHQLKSEILAQLEKIYPYLFVLPAKVPKPKFQIRSGNAVRIAELFPEYLNNVDLLITSPPYATALPYLDTDRLSLVILKLLPRKKHKDAEIQMIGTREVSEKQRREAWEYYLSRKHELTKDINDIITLISEYNHKDGIGFRRRNLPALLGRYFLNMLDAMTSAHTLMKKNASAYYVVGNNSTTINDQKLEIHTDKLLYDLGELAGWRKKEFMPMELLSSRDIFKENRGTSETILHFLA